MKKLFVVFSLFFAVSMVLAAGAGSGAGSGNAGGSGSITDSNGMVDSVQQQDRDQQQDKIQQRIHVPEQDLQRLRQQMQEREQIINQQMQDAPRNQQNTLQNQNQVRLTVQAMHDLEQFIPGYGQKIAEHARGFNNSIQATIQAENRAQERNAFQRFFAGGNAEAARILEQETIRNQERIQEMRQLNDECCNGETHAFLQEQLRVMEQEQLRLQELANKEKRKGLFGWLWK